MNRLRLSVLPLAVAALLSGCIPEPDATGDPDESATPTAQSQASACEVVDAALTDIEDELETMTLALSSAESEEQDALGAAAALDQAVQKLRDAGAEITHPEVSSAHSDYADALAGYGDLLETIGQAREQAREAQAIDTSTASDEEIAEATETIEAATETISQSTTQITERGDAIVTASEALSQLCG